MERSELLKRLGIKIRKAAELQGYLEKSMLLETAYPDIFRDGPVRLYTDTKPINYPRKVEALISMHWERDGIKHYLPSDIASELTGMYLHPKYKEPQNESI